MARKKIDRKDKQLYLEFVWLSPAEYDHLVQLLGKEATDNWIVSLNLYIGSKGDKYESHYYTIQVWARKAAAKQGTVIAAKAEASEAGRAADRVIELLKNPQGQLPTADEKVKLAVYVMLRAMQMNWPRLRFHLKDDPTIEARIREEFKKAFQAQGAGR